MADNRLYGGNVVNPSMLGGATATPRQSALSGYTGSGQIPFIDNSRNLEYDPYHQLKLSFTSMMGQTFEKAVEHKRNRAYVQGMSSQVSGMAEEAMETNILTRAWSKAGYRDMEGRVALTNYKASVLKDLESGSLASLTPTEFQQYLNKQRDELMPYINNSSMLVREKLLERAVEEDVGLIQKHSEYHTKFIYDQELNSWNMDFSLQLMDLDASVGSYSYNTAIMNVGSTLGMLMQNDRINTEDKVKMATQVISSMSYAGHVQAADAIRNMPIIPTDSGEMLPLRMFLTPEDDLKIQKGIETGYKRNKDQIQMSTLYESQEVILQAKANPTDTSLPSIEDYDASQWQAVLDGRLSAGKALSNIKEYRVALGGEGQLTPDEIATLYTQGRTAELINGGSSLDAGFKTTLKAVSHLPIQEQVQVFYNAMLAGQTHAPKGIAMVLENSFNRLINGVDVRPEDKEAFNALAQLLASNTYSNSPASTMETLLSGFTDSQTSIIIRDTLRNFQMPLSNNPKDIANAFEMSFNKSIERNSREGQTRLDAIQPKVAQGLEKIENDISESTSNVFWLPGFIKAFGGRSELRQNIISSEFWNSKGNEVARDSQAVYMRGYVTDIYKQLQYDNPHMSYETLVDEAKSIVASNMTVIEDDRYNITFIGNPESPIMDLMQQVETAIDRSELLERVITGFTADAVERTADAEYGNVVSNVRFNRGNMEVELISKKEGKLLGRLSYGLQDIMQVANTEGREADRYRTIQALNSSKIKGSSGMDIKLHPIISEEFRDKVMSTPEEISTMRLALKSLNMDFAEPTRYAGTKVVGLNIPSDSKYYPKATADGAKISQEEFDLSFTDASSEAISIAEEHMVQLPPNRNKEAYQGIVVNIAYTDPEGLKRGDYKAFNDAVLSGDTQAILDALEGTRFLNLKAQQADDISEDALRSDSTAVIKSGSSANIWDNLLRMIRDI